MMEQVSQERPAAEHALKYGTVFLRHRPGEHEKWAVSLRFGEGRTDSEPLSGTIEKAVSDLHRAVMHRRGAECLLRVARVASQGLAARDVAPALLLLLRRRIRILRRAVWAG